MLYFDSIILLVLVILFAHFIADFILQSDWMAVNKSSNITALLAHVFAYGAGLYVVMFLGTSILSRSFEFHTWLVGWVGLNMGLHLIVDALTSRCTSWLWKRGDRHWFFVMIGFDQFLHAVCLLLTLSIFIQSFVNG